MRKNGAGVGQGIGAVEGAARNPDRKDAGVLSPEDICSQGIANHDGLAGRNFEKIQRQLKNRRVGLANSQLGRNQHLFEKSFEA